MVFDRFQSDSALKFTEKEPNSKNSDRQFSYRKRFQKTTVLFGAGSLLLTGLVATSLSYPLVTKHLLQPGYQLGAGIVEEIFTLPTAQASERDDQVKKKAAAEEKLAKTKSELEGVNQKLADTVLNLEKTQSEAAQAQESYQQAALKYNQAQVHQAQVAEQLEAAQKRLQEIIKELDASQKEQGEVQKSVGQVARDLYLNRDKRGVFGLLTNHVSTTELGKYVRNAQLATQIQEQHLRDVKEKIVVTKTAETEQKDLQQQVAALKKQADKLVIQAQQAQVEKETKLSQLQQHLATEKQLSQQLESQKSSLKDDLAQAQAEQSAAAAEIARIDEENRKAAAALAAAKQGAMNANGAGQGVAGGGRSVNSSGFQAGSIFQAPIPGEIHVTSPYGWRVHPVLGTRRLHAGTDIRSACGNEQYAAAAGTVVSTRDEGTGGNTVTINHGLIDGISWVTKYRHMTKFATHPGQHVEKGTLIGYTGATGRVTGCHVHFEIWKNGSTIDPMGMLQK